MGSTQQWRRNLLVIILQYKNVVMAELGTDHLHQTQSY